MACPLRQATAISRERPRQVVRMAQPARARPIPPGRRAPRCPVEQRATRTLLAPRVNWQWPVRRAARRRVTPSRCAAPQSHLCRAAAISTKFADTVKAICRSCVTARIRSPANWPGSASATTCQDAQRRYQRKVTRATLTRTRGVGTTMRRHRLRTSPRAMRFKVGW